MTEKQITQMDRVDLVLAVQELLKDPAIKAEDLSTFTLRNILLDVYVISKERRK